MVDDGRWRDADTEALARARRWRIVLTREAASRGLMAEGLADRTGYPQSRIADWLAGRTEITVIDVEVLLTAMALPLDDFLRMVATLDADDAPPSTIDPWVIRSLPGCGE